MNFLQLTLSMNFVATHIYREGNQCADILAGICFNVNNFTVWIEVPDSSRTRYVRIT